VKSLLDILLNQYFIIDVPREEIFESEKMKTPSAEGQTQQDLISQISGIMLENEHLLDIQKELEARSSSPELMEPFIRKMITILDGIERILTLARQYPPSEEVNNWLKSIETIYYRLLDILEKNGLKILDSTGKQVNLNFHDVVEYRPTKDYPHETIICERQKGYLLNGKLIRDAKVVVAYNPSSS
jgi:molecular chaperone GrpE (heat shock protein)